MNQKSENVLAELLDNFFDGKGDQCLAAKAPERITFAQREDNTIYLNKIEREKQRMTEMLAQTYIPQVN
jgi:hypothetical protein